MLTQLAGRALAWLEVARYRRHYRLLDELAGGQTDASSSRLRWDQAHRMPKPSSRAEKRRKAG
jgi:hypothetical protein